MTSAFVFFEILRFSYEYSGSISNLDDQKPLQKQQKPDPRQAQDADESGIEQVDPQRNSDECADIVQKKQRDESTDGVDQKPKHEANGFEKEGNAQQNEDSGNNYDAKGFQTE